MNKRETWEWIKKTCPNTADFIREVSEIMGKLDNVKIIAKERKTDGRDSDITSDKR